MREKHLEIMGKKVSDNNDPYRIYIHKRISILHKGRIGSKTVPGTVVFKRSLSDACKILRSGPPPKRVWMQEDFGRHAAHVHGW